MKRSLDLLSAVFANPAAGAPLLDELRAGWRDLAPEERAALTPLAKLAAERVKAAPQDDPDGYWAALENEPPPDDDGSEAGWRDDAPTGGGTAAWRGEPATAGDTRASGAAAGRGDTPAAGTAAWRGETPASPDPAPVASAAPAPVTAAGRAAGQDQLAFGAPSPTSAARDARAPRPSQRRDARVAPEPARPQLLPPRAAGGGAGGARRARRARGHADRRRQEPLLPAARARERRSDRGRLAADRPDARPVHAAHRPRPSRGDARLRRRTTRRRWSRSATRPRPSCSPPPSVSPARRSGTPSASARSRCSSSTRRTACPSGATTSARTTCGSRASSPSSATRPTMACTATATPKVAEEIVTRLGLRDPERVRSGFDRPNLSFDVLPFDGEGSQARKRATLIAGLQLEENRPAVVYCGTRKSTEETALMLQQEGLSTAAYHAGMPAEQRTRAQDAFMSGRADVVVATNAFGMGVDKADVRSVWHVALPSSLEAYYQEAGRAGRDGAPAKAVLLASRSDLGRLVRFIREAEVTVEQVAGLVNRAPGGGRARRRRRQGPHPARGRRARGGDRARPGPGRPRPRPAHRPPGPRPGLAAVPRRGRPPLAVLPQHRALRRDGRPLPAPPAARPLRRQLARRPARPLLRRPRPAHVAAADRGQAEEAGAGRGRPAGLRRRARAPEGLAPRARRRQARLHGRHRRHAQRGRAPQAALRAGAAADQGHRRSPSSQSTPTCLLELLAQ